MTETIWSKVSYAGDSIIIETPKDAPDAQHAHTVKFFDALNELRRREADRIEPFNDHVAGLLREPMKIYSRENPAGLTRGSKYLGNQRVWRPVLPVQWWKAPKPLSDKAAVARARRIKCMDYTPKSPSTRPTGATPDKFQLISFEEDQAP